MSCDIPEIFKMSLKTGSSVILIYAVNLSLITFLTTKILMACPVVMFLSILLFFLFDDHPFSKQEM